MLFLLISAPLLWILRFKDKGFAFVSVISFIVAINAFVAIFLQTFGIFNFKLLLSIHIISAILSLTFNFRHLIQFFKSSKKISWFFVVMISIILLQFYFVHFNYTGKIVTITGVKEVENFVSSHPQFSDEWIAVGMSEKIIETSKLPFVNIFNESFFVNFLFVFHSLISGVDLILNLDLIQDFRLISIFFSLITISFSYLLIRSFNISVGISIFCAFLISYLPNGSNLPMLWYLLPWNLGFIFLLAYFYSVQKGYFKHAIIFNIISIVFYPPIVILSLPSFVFSIFKVKERREKINNLSIYFGLIILGIISALMIFSVKSSIEFNKILNIATDFIVRDLNSFAGEPPLFIVWRVIPWFIAPFAIWSLWKKRRDMSYISIPIFTGLILWFLYSVKMQTFFMDYHRIVSVTSILLIILASFSLEDFKNYILLKLKFLSQNNVSKYLLATFLFLMFILSFSFTEREVWRNFRMLQFDPAPPINNYLTQGDLDLFKDIKNERFLAVPWKGLVLAVATKNTPVVTKDSTLTAKIVDYQKFMLSDCEAKKETLKKFKVNYVYTPEIKCDGLKLVGKSSEGLHLYLVE